MSMALLGVVFFGLLAGRVPALPLAVGCLGVSLLLLLYSKVHGHGHEGLLRIDENAQRSPLRSVNAAFKAACAVGLLLCCVVSRSPWVCAYAIGVMFVVAVLPGGIAPLQYLSFFKIPVLFITLSCIAILYTFLENPNAVWALDLGRLTLSVSSASQQKAFLLICTAFAGAACLLTLALTTPVHLILSALRRAKVPRLVVDLMFLIYKFIFLLFDQYRVMEASAKSRMGYRGMAATMRTASRSATSLLGQSFRRAEGYMAAMESRGFEGEIRFLERKYPLKGWQVALAALCFGVLIWIWGFVWAT